MTKTMMPHSGDGTLIALPVIGKLACCGKTVPTDGADGFAPGCLFLHYDGTAGGTLYVNEGSVTAADFNAVEVTGNTIAAKTITTLTSTTANVTTVDAANVLADTFVEAQGVPTDLADTAVTTTIAQLLTKMITATPTANRAQVLPTGTLMSGGKAIAIGEAFDWMLLNLAAATYTETVQAGTDHTVVGNMVVAANSSGVFRSRKTAATTWVTYRIG